MVSTTTSMIQGPTPLTAHPVCVDGRPLPSAGWRESAVAARQTVNSPHSDEPPMGGGVQNGVVTGGPATDGGLS
jgi:hypothetical protein